MADFFKWLFQISNRTDCEKGCIFYKRGECNFYGKGHRAKEHCIDYMYYKPDLHTMEG